MKLRLELSGSIAAAMQAMAVSPVQYKAFSA